MKHPLGAFRSVNLVVPFHEVPSRDWFVNALQIIGRFYRFVSLADVQSYFLEGTRFDGCCHVTFDDGHSSFYRDAFPILQRLRIPATVFVSPKVVAQRSNYWFQDLTQLQARAGDSAIRDAICVVFGCSRDRIDGFPVMSLFLSMRQADMQRVLAVAKARHPVPLVVGCNITVDELREVAASGLVTAGAHTIDHPVLGNETDDRAGVEIRQSVADLAEMLDRPVTAFAYPNGSEGFDFGAREQHFLRDAGIRVAFATDVGFFDPTTNPLAIPRGGCPSLQGESRAWTMARLMFLPFFDRGRQLMRPRALSEAGERRAIKALQIFPN